MKTLEFKAYLTPSQSTQVDDWLRTQNSLWNMGLALLKGFEQQRYYNKADKVFYPCSPIGWEYRWLKSSDGWIPVPFSPLYSCRWYPPTELLNDSEFTLMASFAHKRHPDKPWLTAVPSSVNRGTISALITAWKEYRKGNRKSPRFKTKSEPLKTLNCCDTVGLTFEGNWVKLPKLGPVRIHNKRGRWPAGLRVATWRIKKEHSGYYLFLVGEVPEPDVKPSELVAGFDAGITTDDPEEKALAHILHDDMGRHIPMPLPLQRSLERLKRLQQKVSRAKKGSANQAKAVKQVGRLHERIRRMRKAWHHEISTRVVRQYGTIVVEDLQLQNMTKRPAPKPDGKGGFLPNQASAKSGLNRKLNDAGIGQLFRLIDEKSTQRNRQLIRVNPAYTSQTCSQCGHVSPDNRQGKTFACTACGYTDHADTNAAKNLKAVVHT